MTRMLEKDFIPKVGDTLSNLGYNVTLEPSRIPNWSMWQNDPASLIRGPKYRPDILVEHDQKYALVEVKTRAVLIGGVSQARQYSEYFDMPVILCVPDDVVDQVPRSVREFAGGQSIHICSLSDLGKVVVDILGDPPTSTGQVMFDSVE